MILLLEGTNLQRGGLVAIAHRLDENAPRKQFEGVLSPDVNDPGLLEVRSHHQRLG